MKKLIILVTALAMVACFMPKVWAMSEEDAKKSPPTETIPIKQVISHDGKIKKEITYFNPQEKSASANLNLKVTFDLAQEPTDGKYDERIQELSIKLDKIANDAEKVYNSAKADSKVITVEKAIAQLKELACDVQSIQNELQEIAAKIRISQKISSIDGKEAVGPWVALLKVSAKAEKLLVTINGYIEELKGGAVEEPVIAIELSETNLNFEGMKLGEKRSAEFGITNTGTVPVMVDMGYSGVVEYSYDENGYFVGLAPGTKQDVDTYVTEVFNEESFNVLPPSGRIIVTGGLAEDQKQVFNLNFGAPTALYKPVDNLNISYELRAYPADTEITIYQYEKTDDRTKVVTEIEQVEE